MKTDITLVNVDPGICGFPCTIRVRKEAGRSVSIEILGTECGQIKRLAGQLTGMSLQELFLPAIKNPVFVLAHKSKCHPSCPIPLAVLKTVEVAMGMAAARPVSIQFGDDHEK